ncbi:hypothetical protein RGU70_02335 [Herbaspirillum sp. RTI4]|uniref:hypothetical protein n=1 Tax=Herbaspirillum sp. RTI4 TaxID=3048640 RepID=UPI002AB43FE1|nr:hypothetical protein [Herbaspirillum sp. RTI4]MDY7577165.1 hypothetical protein [Herbaspirillum sp. RTI4]MEA9980455.1 hypothetical protein [Herbaspirillum sp. RTI4]
MIEATQAVGKVAMTEMADMADMAASELSASTLTSTSTLTLSAPPQQTAQESGNTGFPVAQPHVDLSAHLAEQGVKLSEDLHAAIDRAQTMIQSIDFNDPLMAMWKITDVNAQMQQISAEISIANGVVGAANNFFGALLKNQG